MRKSQAFLVACLLMILPLQTAMSAYQVGDTVAEFSLPDAYGQTVRYSDYEGMVVLINFWANW